jgi:hypothetical protein
MNRKIPIIGNSNLIYLLKIPPTIRSCFLVLKNVNSTDIIKGINYFIANSKQFNITSNFTKQYSKFNPKIIALELFYALYQYRNMNFAKNKFSKNFKSL